MYIDTTKNSKLRSISGWVVMTIACVVCLYITFYLLLLSYNIFIGITPSSRELDWLITTRNVAVKIFAIYLCYEVFRWGRHLIRPGRTEYV